MGKPVKLTLNDEVVFLCCSGCEGAAKRDPEKTVALVKKLRAGTP